MAQLQIIHTNSFQAAADLEKQGFEPIECSFGNLGSVVGAFQMDHHNSYSHLEGVAVRAYRDHYGSREDDPRFVVTGAADADACFAIASLAGLIPHPSWEKKLSGDAPGLPWPMTRSLDRLADLVNLMDTEPIGVDITALPDGGKLLLWNHTKSHVQDATAFYGGVDRWRWILNARPPAEFIDMVMTAEEVRRKEASKFLQHKKVSENVVALSCAAWGFDVWYAEAPCIVALNPHEGSITIGCRDTATSKKLFGEHGLKSVFALLGEGWGGRESIGGSPRGMKMTWEDTLTAAMKIAAVVAR